MATAISRRLFTVDEYSRMVDAGILAAKDRVELIEGEILAMTRTGPRHIACVNRTLEFLVTALAGRAIAGAQGSVQIGRYSQPEPDIVLLGKRADYYASRHPGPADILLIIEVADSSLDYDRDVKAPLYARARVPEYWLVNLRENVIVCHAQPDQDTYRHVETFRRGQILAPALLPDCGIPADVLLTA